MEQTKPSFSLQCPDHGLAIGMLSTDPKAHKIGYCFECIAENGGDATFLQTLKTVSSYLKDNSSFYEKCRQRVSQADQTPANFLEELSKKGERLERFSKYIDEEKEEVKKTFERIRKNLIEIIDEKEKKCFELLDKEIFSLSEVYLQYEQILMMGWPEPSEIQNMYPDIDILRQRMSKIENLSQLRTFMAGIKEDIHAKDLYFAKEDSLNRIKKRADRLVTSFSIPETSLPKIQANILNSQNIENLMIGFMKEFIRQEIHVKNSILSRINALSYESKIASDTQFEILKDWLPKNYKFHLKLLYRGSVDGMSSEIFHEKCDGKGATITLIQCRFDKAQKILGGFLNESWHSRGGWGKSADAFLFSLGEQKENSIKCSPFQHSYAFNGNPHYGPSFGAGPDLHIEGGFKTGSINPASYSNAIALCSRHGNKFQVEDIEVFQVQ